MPELPTKNEMGVESPSHTPDNDYPDCTEADREAMFASVVWFDDQLSTGSLEQFQGKFVAIADQRVLMADPDEDELIRRVYEAFPAEICDRMVTRYVQRLDEVTR